MNHLELAGIPLAFLTGVLSSFGHCLGMCGPLAAAVSMRAAADRPHAASLAAVNYHSGRIVTYAAVGALMGLSGRLVGDVDAWANVQLVVRAVAGLFMVLTGLGFATSALWLHRVESALSTGLAAAIRRFLHGGTRRSAFVSGLALGLLPCGLSYSIFLGAAATGGPWQGFLFAAAFGLGTAPALLMLGAAVGWLETRWRIWLHRLGGLTVAAAGAMFLVSAVRDLAAS